MKIIDAIVDLGIAFYNLVNSVKDNPIWIIFSVVSGIALLKRILTKLLDG